MAASATYRLNRAARRRGAYGRKGGGKGTAQDFRTPVQQPDTAQSSAEAHVLDIIGVGPMGGLVNGLKSWYYDDTPVMNNDGSINFDGVSIQVRPGLPDQTPMPGFFRTEIEVVVGIEATIEEGPVVQRIDNPDASVARVKVRFPDGLMEQIEDEDAPNYGDVVATPVEFSIEMAPDGAGFSHIPGSPFTVNEKTSANYEAQYEFDLPAGLAPWDIRLTRITEDSTDGNPRNRTMFGTVTEIIDTRLTYSGTCVVGQIVNAAQFGSRVPARSGDFIGVEVPVPSNYDPVTHTYDPEIWDGTFKTEATENPVWHIYNLMLNTEYGSGQDLDTSLVPKLALYEIARYCDGRVPNEETPRRPQFVQTLDSPPTYNLQVSMLAHGYEVGDYVWIEGCLNEEANGLHQIDFVPSPNFFTIVDAVTSPVFDNNPQLRVYSTEPRFTLNTVLNVQQAAYDIYAAIASCFRAQPYWSAGGVYFSQDAPADGGRLIGRANTLDGEFTYSGPGIDDRITAVKVTWNDPDDGFRPAIEYVEDGDMIERFGLIEAQVVAVGATTRSQARRHGRWMLLTQRYCSQVLTYRAGLDNAMFRPGEIVQVNDPVEAGVRHVGKVAGFDSATGAAQIELDSPVDLDEGQSYAIAVVMEDGTVETREVVNEAGDGQTLIDVSPPFSATPILTGAMWGLSGGDVALRQFRIFGVRQLRADQFEVTAVAHQPDLYDAVDAGGAVTPIDFTDIPTGRLLAPTSLEAVETLYSDGLGIQPRALFSWTRPDDPRVTMFELQVMRPGTFAFAPYDDREGITQSLSATLRDAVAGVYRARVRGRDNLGRTSAWYPHGFGKEFLFVGLDAVPPTPQNFRTAISIQRVKLQWDAVSSLIHDHYELRFSPLLVGATWAGALVINDQIPRDQLDYDDIVQSGTYFLKSISVRGKESLDAAQLVVNVIGNINLNQIETVDEHPSWAGDKTNVEVVGDYLQLSGDEGSFMSSWSSLAEVVTLTTGVGAFEPMGIYQGSQVIDLGSVFDVRVTPEIASGGYNVYNVIGAWSSLAEVANMAGFVEGEVGVEFLVDITRDDPAALDAVWDGYKPLIGADVRARGIRWRLVLTTTKPWITPRVSALTVVIDMYDRIVDGRDVPTTGGTAAITFTPPFRSPRPAAIVTIQNMQQGDYYTIKDSDDDDDGPDDLGMIVRTFNASGDPVLRTIDYIVRGHGAVIT